MKKSISDYPIRPDTYKKPEYLPDAKSQEEHWKQKTTPWMLKTSPWSNNDTLVADATSTAAAWLKHPANKMQLPSIQKEYDADGDGVTNKSEFQVLLKAVGSNADASILFDAMDADGDGFLSEAEIKALGQDRDGRARAL